MVKLNSKKLKKNKIFSFIILILCVIAYFTWFILKENADKTTVEIVQNNFDLIYGYDSVPINIVMYSSYQCVFCRKFFDDDLQLLLDNYIDNKKAKLTIKLVELSADKQIIESLKVAACINKYGNIKPLHNLLLTEPDVIFTKEFGEVVEEFIQKDNNIAECMLAGESEIYLNNNLNIFKEIGLTGTPSFIINNRIYKGYHSFNDLQKILDKN